MEVETRECGVGGRETSEATLHSGERSFSEAPYVSTTTKDFEVHVRSLPHFQQNVASIYYEGLRSGRGQDCQGRL